MASLQPAWAPEQKPTSKLKVMVMQLSAKAPGQSPVPWGKKEKRYRQLCLLEHRKRKVREEMLAVAIQRDVLGPPVYKNKTLGQPHIL